MTLFFKKIIIFAIPFIFIIAVEIMIDPFNYFSKEENTILLNLKMNISRKINTNLYKLIEYERNPCPIIIIGESRAIKLTPQFFKDFSNEKVSNLAAGGASLQDVINIFWEVIRKHKINKVYISISLSSYNGILLRDRVTESIQIKESWPLYLLNINTFESTFLICKSLLFNTQIVIDKPSCSREEFWKYQLADSRLFHYYKYPENYYEELTKISQYCHENNIDLVFFIAPTHTDLQKRIIEFGLLREYQRFKNDIKSFGDLYDFEIPNELTKEKNNFSDPYHCYDSISRIVVSEMVLKKPKYSNFTKCLYTRNTKSE